jgi:hypothetical protein
MRCINYQADGFRINERLQPVYATKPAYAYAADQIIRHAAQPG